MMTAAEMIRMFGIEKRGGDKIALLWNLKKAKTMEAEIRAAKPEILAELARREQVAAQKAAEEKAAYDARREALQSGDVTFDLHYYDGEYLSGYAAFGADADVLKAEGAARDVVGWGTHVAVAETLGTLFTLQELRAHLAPVRAEEAAKKAAAEAELAEKVAEALNTGKPVVLHRWVDECRGGAVECSMDICEEVVLPDGTIERQWTHAF